MILSMTGKKTKKEFNDLEQALVACYITFLRKTAKYCLLQGRRVYFRENNIVHWVSGNWRIVFTFKESNAYQVNYVDYH